METGDVVVSMTWQWGGKGREQARGAASPRSAKWGSSPLARARKFGSAAHVEWCPPRLVACGFVR